MSRKPLGKKLRFEVFKRDSFTCQYCGAKAPDVILHVDHLSPVSSGGSNDILNLITACDACNLGKGARAISDNAEVEKQRAQLEQLNERRLQMEQMLAWREELRSIEDDALDAASQRWFDLAKPNATTEAGDRTLRDLIGKFGLALVLDAIEAAAGQYLEHDARGATPASAGHAFAKLGGICRNKSDPSRAHMPAVYYMRGILRRRFGYVNDNRFFADVKAAIAAGLPVDDLTDFAKRCSSCARFHSTITEFLSEEVSGE